MSTDNTQSHDSYAFAIKLNEPLHKKNSHDQLYAALDATGGDWYQAQNNEPRNIQFIQRGAFLFCRSNRKPPDGVAVQESVSVTNGDYIEFNVRLPMSQRVTNDKGKQVIAPLPVEDSPNYFKELLNKKGIKVFGLKSSHALGYEVRFDNVCIATADVQVIAQVTCSDDFINAYKAGVGRFKTYGCGMITDVTNIEGAS